jgi:hypothetical protein
MHTRRALLLPLLAACASDDEPVAAAVPPGPIEYKHLTPLPLNVAAVEVVQTRPAAVPSDVGASLSPSPTEAVRIMGRDRLVAVGTTSQAIFAVTQASLVRTGNTLTCLVACRLEIVDAEGERRGFVEAQSRRSKAGPDAMRPRADEALLREAMDDLNVEFEFQLRRALKDWLVQVTPGAAGVTPDSDVTQEVLPKS